MGIINGGVLGGFRKKTGAIVGARWRTLDVIRGLPRKSGKARTQKQKDQQFKFGLVTGFCGNIPHLINDGFASAAKAATPMNDAVSYHMENAVIGVSPLFKLDYTKIVFSKGRLERPGLVDVASTALGEVEFNWMHTSPDDLFVDSTDRINLMVYCPAQDRFVVLRMAAPRSAKTFTMPVPVDMSGETVHCYINFTSVITKGLRSKSQHVGVLILV